MAVSIRKLVALIMLVVLTSNVWVWESSSARLAHQIVHLGLVEQSAASHSHPGLATYGELGTPAVLHDVLHAVDHMQHLADLTVQTVLHLPSPDGACVVASELPPAPAVFAPPYRPPSGAAILA